LKPRDADDIQFAARLVMDGFIDQELMQSVLATQASLMEKGKEVTIPQICIKKGWLSKREALFLMRPEAPPANLFPGYTIKSSLGSGGMSQVYLAHSEALGHDVALKVLKPHLARNEKALIRFKKEAELLISFEDENIVKGYAVAEADGLHAFSMELVPGSELLELIDNHGPMEEDAALYVILQIGRALTCMYGHGVVHRDIKPGNILITPDNTIKLCDLGLASADGEKDDEGLTVGTVEYIAPEQALDANMADIRSDIYALGVTLYHLVLGETPFSGDNDQEIMGKRFFETLNSSSLSHLSPHMHYFLQKMMATDKEIRYQAPSELLEDIEEQIRGKKTLNQNPSAKGGSSLELDRPFGQGPKKGLSAPTSSRKKSGLSPKPKGRRRR
jgi:serine/threonine protein kinase